MRKLLLALSGAGLACGSLLLLLATFEVAASQTLPLGALAGLFGVAMLLAVLLVGQRTVMERTSLMVRRFGPGQGIGVDEKSFEALRSFIDETVRESNQALAWSLDARIVGLVEQFEAWQPESGRTGEGDD